MIKYSTNELINKKGDLDQLKNKPRNEVYLILDNIRSVHNVGAIFRTSDAARIKKLYLCGYTPHPKRTDLEKTALNTIDHVPWEQNNNIKAIIKILKRKKVQIVALEQTDKSVDYKKFNYLLPVAIIIGNEVTGVETDVLRECDAAIEIPMYGIANSLNVATATGIVLYNLI